MHELIRFEKVSKKFGRTNAVNSLTCSVGPSRIVGLVGTNGSGKSTMLRLITGIYLPTSGEVLTLGKSARHLGPAELTRIGMVHQREDFLSWMTVSGLLNYVSSFYPKWDWEMQKRLCDRMELRPRAEVEKLSPGMKQRLAIVMATCHHPELIILDEPLSDLDPIAREAIVQLLLDIYRDDAPTIVISSHLLHDIERIIDHVICLNAGRLVLDEPLDRIHERFAEWSVTSLNGRLPAHFNEPWIVSQSGDDRRRILVVSDAEQQREHFQTRYSVSIESRPMNLDRIFTHVVTNLRRPGPGHDYGDQEASRS